MKFLITNDDGVDAAGLHALLEAAQDFGGATIVARAAPQSGVSQAVTWHEGGRIEPRGEKRQSARTVSLSTAHRRVSGLLHLVPDANCDINQMGSGVRPQF